MDANEDVRLLRPEGTHSLQKVAYTDSPLAIIDHSHVFLNGSSSLLIACGLTAWKLTSMRACLAPGLLHSLQKAAYASTLCALKIRDDLGHYDSSRHGQNDSSSKVRNH